MPMRGDVRTGDPGRAARAAVAGIVLLAARHAAAAPGGSGSRCIDLCESVWTDYTVNGVVAPCVVDSDYAVIGASAIDCRPLPVEVRTHDLTVTDASFTLRAASLLVKDNHAIRAVCQSGTAGDHGFRIETTGSITVEGTGKLEASCALTGGAAGTIDLAAGDDVTLTGANAVEATAGGLHGAGGHVRIRTADDVVVYVPVDASGNLSIANSVAQGGSITIAGDAVSILGGLYARARSSGGGTIAVSAEGDLTVGVAGDVDASGSAGAGGDGGEVSLQAGGTLACGRPVKAGGGSAAGQGGEVDLFGDWVEVTKSITTSAGTSGGDITIESRRGRLRVLGDAAVTLDLRRNSNNPGDGGTASLRSLGNDVVLGANVTIDAAGGGTGSDGGSVELAGVHVVLPAGAKIDARRGTGTSASGGTVVLEAADTMTLDGIVQADTSNGGTILLRYRTTAPSPGAGVESPREVVQDATIADPCGDGLVATLIEDCEPDDLNGVTCPTVPGQSFTGGTLACSSTCTFDTSGCTP
jgi:hypothetical protein